MTLTRDPAVPCRDALLEGAAVARTLGVSGCERTYAKYRVGDSVRVVHRTDAGAYVAARSFRDPANAYERDGARPGVICAPALGAVLWTFPADRRIEALPLLAGPNAALDRLLGMRCAGTRLVSYAAERSATAACLDSRGRVIAFAKVHAGDGAARELRATRSVGPCGANLRVPRVLGGDGAALALEPLPGRRLDTLPAEDREHGLERLGAALATLHELRPDGGAPFRRFAPDRLARAAATVATAWPAAGSAAFALHTALRGRHADAAGSAVCLHGDANPRNALLDGGRVSLIDLEHVAAGPAAADVGQVLAALLCARVSGDMSAAEEQRLARALLRGYACISAPPGPATLAWHTAASVLARRALAAVNRVRTADLRRLDGFLRAAGALLR